MSIKSNRPVWKISTVYRPIKTLNRATFSSIKADTIDYDGGCQAHTLLRPTRKKFHLHRYIFCSLYLNFPVIVCGTLARRLIKFELLITFFGSGAVKLAVKDQLANWLIS